MRNRWHVIVLRQNRYRLNERTCFTFSDTKSFISKLEYTVFINSWKIISYLSCCCYGCRRGCHFYLYCVVFTALSLWIGVPLWVYNTLKNIIIKMRINAYLHWMVCTMYVNWRYTHEMEQQTMRCGGIYSHHIELQYNLYDLSAYLVIYSIFIPSP